MLVMLVLEGIWIPQCSVRSKNLSEQNERAEPTAGMINDYFKKKILNEHIVLLPSFLCFLT